MYNFVAPHCKQKLDRAVRFVQKQEELGKGVMSEEAVKAQYIALGGLVIEEGKSLEEAIDVEKTKVIEKKLKKKVK